ncbi:unnamed protein product [Spirodela intermedia]|uniref:Serine aminopeptidase S33 domain-containing protein n=1 Tax=Spirodela intermedia TaxID=51605 RepID=A0A7I8IBB3_SPIIN|nr:unnamed protein product [Spirodela intermedia]CAA6654870.1 unnamed protein product [Spirodela intermedia]
MADAGKNSVKYVYEEVRIHMEFRGAKLFTCQWLPKNSDAKALIFLCHGYGMECSISMRGHGKSAGLQGLVSSFDDLVDDCSEYFTHVCEKEENRKKKRFLLGESMGGAVALLLHRKKLSFWNGAVLVAPMCKISDELKPHPLVVKMLIILCKIVPTWKLMPTQDIIDVAFKDPEKRREVRENPLCYKGRPRLKTAYELFMASQDIEKKLHKVSLPFIVVHGGDDIVTDPSVSQLLYESAASTDKTFKLYRGCGTPSPPGSRRRASSSSSPISSPGSTNARRGELREGTEDRARQGNLAASRQRESSLLIL